MSISKLSSIVQYVLFGISILLIGLFFFGGVVPGTEGTRHEEPLITNTTLIWAYVLFGIALVMWLGFSVVNLFSDKQRALKALTVLGIMAVIFLLALSLASNEPMRESTEATSKIVGTGLISMYILLGVAVVAILYTEVIKYFKK